MSDIQVNTASIVQAGRALMSCLQPFTGEQSFGKVRMKAKSGKQFRLRRYTYLMPIIDGAQHWSWLFKVNRGPEPDGSWLIGDVDVDVDVYSAIGGQRFNVTCGTSFVFDYLIQELDIDPAPYTVADFIGGQEPQDNFACLHDAAVYETFDGPAIPLDLRRSLLTRFPAVLVAFIDLMPADGVTSAQTSSGGVNAGDGTKFYKVNFAISLIVSRTDNDLNRRFQGMVMTDRLLAEFVDRHAAHDGEPLSNPGGVQIRQVIRESGPQDLYKKFFIYTLLVSVMTCVTRTERRWDRFPPWLRTRVDIDHPQTPALPNQGSLNIVNNMLIDMPEQPDLTLDGTFTRASAATYWDGSMLVEYAANERRIIGGDLFIEPAVANVLGARSTDFTLWSLQSGATVAALVASNPAGSPAAADVLTFGASNLSGLEDIARAAVVGQPCIVYVFVKATAALADAFKLTVDDGVAEYESELFDVTTAWKQYRFEFTPTATPVILRILNGLGTAHSVAVWGAFYDPAARWGAEFAVSKAKDVLTFLPGLSTDPHNTNRTPAVLLDGSWLLKVRTPDYVDPELVGAGLASAPVLVSINDGSTNLLMLTLSGTPSSGGATFTLSTRGSGVVLTLTGMTWIPGDVLEFWLDAAGQLELVGTQTHDGLYSFSRYDVDALPLVDRLVLGSDASGAKGAVPGFYSVEINV